MKRLPAGWCAQIEDHAPVSALCGGNAELKVRVPGWSVDTFGYKAAALVLLSVNGLKAVAKQVTFASSLAANGAG